MNRRVNKTSLFRTVRPCTVIMFCWAPIQFHPRANKNCGRPRWPRRCWSSSYQLPGGKTKRTRSSIWRAHFYYRSAAHGEGLRLLKHTVRLREFGSNGSRVRQPPPPSPRMASYLESWCGAAEALSRTPGGSDSCRSAERHAHACVFSNVTR